MSFRYTRWIIQDSISYSAPTCSKNTVHQCAGGLLEGESVSSQTLGLIGEAIFGRATEEHWNLLVRIRLTFGIDDHRMIHDDQFPDLRSIRSWNAQIEIGRDDSNVFSRYFVQPAIVDGAALASSCGHSYPAEPIETADRVRIYEGIWIHQRQIVTGAISTVVAYIQKTGRFKCGLDVLNDLVIQTGDESLQGRPGH